MLKRPLSALERYYNESGTMGQMGLRLKSPKMVPDFVEKIKSSVMGLHLATTPTHFVSRPEEPHVFKIPDNLSIKDCCEFMYERHSPQFSDRIAVLGSNSDTIVINCGHICADGGYMLHLLKNLLQPNFKSTHFTFPADVEELFQPQLAANNKSVPHFFVDPTITRVMPKRPVTQTFEHCPYDYLACDIKELKCYDQKTGKVAGLTEALWTSSVLSSCAFNNRITQSGVATCVDMRYLTDAARLSWALCNCYANINVTANINPDQTLNDLGLAMRRDMARKVKDGFNYAFLQSLTSRAPSGEPLPGIGLELSNMGVIKIKDPVEDVWLRSSIRDITGEPFLSFSSYSIASETRNQWRANVRYRSALIDKKDAEAVSRGAFFALKTLPMTMTVRDAMREIQKFQEQYR